MRNSKFEAIKDFLENSGIKIKMVISSETFKTLRLEKDVEISIYYNDQITIRQNNSIVYSGRDVAFVYTELEMIYND